MKEINTKQLNKRINKVIRFLMNTSALDMGFGCKIKEYDVFIKVECFHHREGRSGLVPLPFLNLVFTKTTRAGVVSELERTHDFICSTLLAPDANLEYISIKINAVPESGIDSKQVYKDKFDKR